MEKIRPRELQAAECQLGHQPGHPRAVPAAWPARLGQAGWAPQGCPQVHGMLSSWPSSALPGITGGPGIDLSSTGSPTPPACTLAQQLCRALPRATRASGDSPQQHLCTHSFIPKPLPRASYPSHPCQGKCRTNHSKHSRDIPDKNSAGNKQVSTQTGFFGEGRKRSATFYLRTAVGISGAKLNLPKHRGQQQSSLSQQ